MSILTGRIDITDNLPFVIETINSQNPSVVVINLDEDNQQLKNNRCVLGGTELLPSPDIIMCEIDGDEATYDYLYSMHFRDPFVVQYVTAIIGALYAGKSILMYYPTLDPSETKTVPKLIDQFWRNFGIGIGLLGYNIGVYDNSKLPLWCKLLYTANIMNPKEFMILAPVEQLGNDMEIMEKLMFELSPYGTIIQDKLNYLTSYWRNIKKTHNLKIPFHGL